MHNFNRLIGKCPRRAMFDSFSSWSSSDLVSILPSFLSATARDFLLNFLIIFFRGALLAGFPLFGVLDSPGNNQIQNSPAPSAMHIFEQHRGRTSVRHGNGNKYQTMNNNLILPQRRAFRRTRNMFPIARIFRAILSNKMQFGVVGAQISRPGMPQRIMKQSLRGHTFSKQHCSLFAGRTITTVSRLGMEQKKVRKSNPHPSHLFSPDTSKYIFLALTCRDRTQLECNGIKSNRLG